MRIFMAVCGVVIVVAFVYVAYGLWRPDAGVADTTFLTSLTRGPVTLTLPEGLLREDIARIVGEGFGFDEPTEQKFHNTYRIMQWDAFKDVLVPHLLAEHEWGEADREVVLTHNTRFLNTPDDPLERLYVPGEYTMGTDDTVAQIAEKLIAPVLATSTDTFVPAHLHEEGVASLVAYVERERMLLPDLVPLPPQDIGVRDDGARRLLVFTTLYYNQGRGDLELRADYSTIGQIGDFERHVNQRIYERDGGFSQRHAGTFEWHHEHLHYHFADFVVYSLHRVDGEVEVALTDPEQKSTFCIRDVSKVHLPDVTPSENAVYEICGRERQGISVGWGDAYFHTYADQNFDISELASGQYRLSFYVNPADRFIEETKENNESSALILYDKDAGTIEVLETVPSELPSFEHINIEDIITS